MSEYTVDWDAIATASAGVMALVAALAIGRRQMTIMDRQTEIQASHTKILDRQAAQDSKRLQWELFDRRFEIYLAALDYVCVLTASQKKEYGSPEADKFHLAMREADFLYADDVVAKMEEIWAHGQRMRTVRILSETYFNANAQYDHDLLDQEEALDMKTIEYFNGLREMFRELKVRTIEDRPL